MKLNHIYQGDALEVLKTFPDESINCVMTSPPYWALRDYGIEGQLGLEPTFEEHITKMCDVFDEVKRVLRKDGTCWVNYGDTYNNDPSNQQFSGDRPIRKIEGMKRQKRMQSSIPAKSLTLIPFRFAIEMVNRGWICRNVIIWHKPNCMPQSAKDRFTVDFEYLFFFVKSKKYWFERQFEKHSEAFKQKVKYGWKGNYEKGRTHYEVGAGAKKGGFSEAMKGGYGLNPQGRNKRCVWKIPTQPFPEAHFAVYPEKLCVTPIKAGCPPKGVVLDPFMGSGTTAVVARKLGRNWVGIELNPDYIKIAERRLRQKVLWEEK